MPGILFPSPSSFSISAITSGILGSFACSLNAANKSNSEFSSISTPKLYNCLIGALQAKKSCGLGQKDIIFKFCNPKIVVSIGSNSLIISATSSAVPTGYSGIYALIFLNAKL